MKEMVNMLKRNKRILGLLMVFGVVVGLFSGCTDDTYKTDLENGRQKYYSDQPMTKGEYEAVQNFNKWKDSQGSKTYSQWEN